MKSCALLIGDICHIYLSNIFARGYHTLKGYGSLGEVGCTISSFICLSAGAIEWQPCFFATILLLYASPKETSVLVLLVIFGD